MDRFPTRPDELTDAWLTDVLRGAGALGAGRSVVEHSTTTIGEGISLLGLVQRVALVYDDGAGDTGPQSVVIKFATPIEANSAIAMNTNMYQREIDFFVKIAPSIDMPLPPATTPPSCPTPATTWSSSRT
jgi:hypothetical protein